MFSDSAIGKKKNNARGADYYAARYTIYTSKIECVADALIGFDLVGFCVCYRTYNCLLYLQRCGMTMCL